MTKRNESIVKTCKECSKLFQTTRKDKIFCTNECTKAFNKREWSEKRYGVRPKGDVCEFCGTKFIPKKIGTKFCKPSCRTGQWRKENPERMAEIRKKSRQNDPNNYWARKRKYVDLLGGKCKCGEGRLPCLTFHHKDPTQKITEVTAMMNNRRLKATDEEILTEVKKCILLCSNCHKIEHADPMWKDF